jgi:hypothetical protein
MTLEEMFAAEHKLTAALAKVRAAISADPNTLRKAGTTSDRSDVLVNSAEVREMVRAHVDRAAEAKRLSKAATDRRGEPRVPDTEALVDSFRASRLPVSSHPAFTAWGSR